MLYESPKIIEEYSIETKTPPLSGSVVAEDSEVESTGQEVETHSVDVFDASGNSRWY